ncbi:AAA family ATPase, partial [Mesorhizobium sp. M5C.F.Ca.IN.020.32.2.1]
MELKTIRIQNFRSVEDSGDFTVEHLTCLVGKNEAGKTAILQALAGLNPHPATPFQYDIERDYPKRFLARYGERHKDREAIVATTTWEIDDAQKALITAEFGSDAVTGNRVTITRSYNSEGVHWSVPVNVKIAIDYLIAHATFSAPEKSQLGTPTTGDELVVKLKELANSNPKH